MPWGGGAFNPLGFQAAIAEDAEDEEGEKEEEKAQEEAKAPALAAVDENPLILWRPGETQVRHTASRTHLCLLPSGDDSLVACILYEEVQVIKKFTVNLFLQGCGTCHVSMWSCDGW